jgi:hypothetical protein
MFLYHFRKRNSLQHGIICFQHRNHLLQIIPDSHSITKNDSVIQIFRFFLFRTLLFSFYINDKGINRSRQLREEAKADTVKAVVCFFRPPLHGFRRKRSRFFLPQTDSGCHWPLLFPPACLLPS